MKKVVVFGLIATVFMSVNANANEKRDLKTPQNHILCTEYSESEESANWIRLLHLAATLILSGGDDSGGIDYQRGTNKVIDGVRHECIDGGVCRIRTGSKATSKVMYNKLSENRNYLVKDAKGNVALLINKREAEKDSNFDLVTGSFYIEQTYHLKSSENCPEEFESYSIKGGEKLPLEELDKHYAVIIHISK